MAKSVFLGAVESNSPRQMKVALYFRALADLVKYCLAPRPALRPACDGCGMGKQ
jgi:hypothetical protein